MYQYMRLDVIKSTVKVTRTTFYGTVLVERQLGKITKAKVREELIRAGFADEKRQLTIDIRNDASGQELVRIPAGQEGEAWLKPVSDEFGEAWYVDYGLATPLWLYKPRPKKVAGRKASQALTDELNRIVFGRVFR